jgi:hypothetical protein
MKKANETFMFKYRMVSQRHGVIQQQTSSAFECCFCTLLDNNKRKSVVSHRPVLFQGRTDAAYLLEADSHVSISNLTSCAGELSVHLQDLYNWGQPVIPPVQDCPQPVFEPNYFVDGSSGNSWICVSANTGELTSVC